MKKIFVWIFSMMMALCVGSCKAKTPVEPQEDVSGASPAEVPVKSGDAATEAGVVQYLNTEQFLSKVFNYRSNPEVFKYEGTLPCIVDFFATWCRPCKMLAPVMDELAVRYEGQVIFYKVDVDQEKELSAAFGIQSIPSLLFIPAEGQPAMQAGLMSKEQLVKVIDSFLLGKTE